MQRFTDRCSAGRELGQALVTLPMAPGALVLGLPRGGVPVAFEVARALKAPLDVMVVRKIGLPSQPELAIGAIASGNIVVQEPQAALYSSLSAQKFQQLVQRERIQLARRERLYRHGIGPLELAGKAIVLVDDGLATGATMLAAARAARAAGAKRITVAAPVASSEAVARLRDVADELLILEIPAMFMAVGEWYEQFAQTSDEEVQELLRRAAHGN